MHPAMIALQRATDRAFIGMGFDRARAVGRLGSYMQMMNRGASGGYKRQWITLAKMNPGVDPLTNGKRNEP